MMIYWIHYSISVIQQMAQNLKVNSAGLKKAAYNHCMPELASRTSGCLELISRAGAECKGGPTLCSLSDRRGRQPLLFSRRGREEKEGMKLIDSRPLLREGIGRHLPDFFWSLETKTHPLVIKMQLSSAFPSDAVI